MFIKVRNYLAPYLTTEDFRVQVRSPPANYVYGCHMTLVTRGALEYVSYQKGIIQWHLVHRYASRRAPAPCSRIMFRTVLPLDVNTRLFSYITCPQNILWGLFLMFFVGHVTHWLLCQTDEIIHFFNPSSVIYMMAQVNSSTIANICWLMQTFKYQCCGFQVHFISILCLMWRPKAIFDQDVHIT